MFQRRQALTHLLQKRSIKHCITNSHTCSALLGQHLAPRVHHHAVAPSLATIHVLPPWAAASIQHWFSTARARSNNSQWAWPVV